MFDRKVLCLVQELVPQFYESGDFLSNSLGIDFGTTQVVNRGSIKNQISGCAEVLGCSA